MQWLPLAGGLSVSFSLMLCGCGGPAGDRELLEQLRGASAKDGLALVGTRGNRIAVIPFDARPRYFQSNFDGLGALSVVIGNRGGMVAWSSGRMFNSQIVVEKMDGEQVYSVTPPVIFGLVPLALHERTKRVLYQGLVFLEGSTIRWMSLERSESGFINLGNSGDWAPDGDSVVYENDAKIYISDLAGQDSKLLGPGYDPAWSPNAKWIAFRDLSGTARLMTPGGERVGWPIDGSRPIRGSRIRWSPDSTYVSFAELNGGDPSIFDGKYRVVVYRVRDGKKLSIRTFGGGWLDPEIGIRDYKWMLDYRSFCKSCKPSGRVD